MSYTAYPDLTPDDHRVSESPTRPIRSYPALMHEWMPGAIFLVLHAVIFVLGIIEGLGQ